MTTNRCTLVELPSGLVVDLHSCCDAELVAQALDCVQERERERCAKIAEQSYCGLADVGFEKFQEIRRKHGAAIAAKIRQP